jgi:hypothetical protein
MTGIRLQVDIVGVAECEAALNRLRETVTVRGKQEMQTEALSCAQTLQRWIQAEIHDVTGRLSRGVQAGAYRGNIPAAFVRVDYKIAPHAIIVEWGTSKMAARPYFRPGIAAASEMILRRLERKATELALRGGAEI